MAVSIIQRGLLLTSHLQLRVRNEPPAKRKREWGGGVVNLEFEAERQVWVFGFDVVGLLL